MLRYQHQITYINREVQTNKNVQYNTIYYVNNTPGLNRFMTLIKRICVF